MFPVALTIAGSDSGGGAGVQADLKTFQELKVFGCSVITVVTAQNTQTVTSIQAIEPAIIADQLAAVLDDFPIKAIKTGMLFSAEIVNTVVNSLQSLKIPIVVDPVMISKSNETLLNQSAIDSLRNQLFPITFLLTPNIPEAEALSGIAINSQEDIIKASEILLNLGLKNLVIKGGHSDNPELAIDFAFIDKKRYQLITPRINTKQTHGTGCTFSAAITAFLAKNYALIDAIIGAKHFIQAAIAQPLNLGHGYGPTNHFAYQQNNIGQQVDVHEF